MDKHPEGAVLIRRYLLGEASDEDRGRVEALLMSDRESFEIALAIEDELADDYVTGRLTQAEHADFETAYLSCKERSEKVWFARLLSSYSRRDADKLAKAARGGDPYRCGRVFRALGIPENRFAPLFASAALGMIAVSGLLLIRNRILANEVREATVHERMAAEETLRVQSESLAEKGRAKQLERRVAEQSSLDVLRGEQIVQLLPGLSRGEGSITSVSILKDTQIVELDLKVLSHPHEDYRVSLHTSNNDEIAVRTGAKALSKPAGIFVPFTFLPSEIPAGEYKVVLETAGELGRRIPLGNYHFRIERNH